MTSVLSDARWRGAHGIGRFASEVLRRLPGHRWLKSGPKPLSLADPLWLAFQVRRLRPRAYFSPGFNPPPACPVPFVFTIHDLIQIRFAGVVSPAKRLYYECVVKPACRRAFRVLTVSEHSRLEILDWSGIPEDRVVVVGNGVGHPFLPDGPRYEPGFPYLLYVGNLRPHKNVGRLWEAFQGLRCPSLRLVLAGPRFAPNFEGSRVRFVGNPTDEELARLYRGALLVVVPSLVEGFGLPALEAMACGTPVLASRAASLPEVVGDAGAYMDPLDVADIRRKLDCLLGDPSRRSMMRERGIRRASLFSWTSVAEKVEAILRAAAH